VKAKDQTGARCPLALLLYVAAAVFPAFSASCGAAAPAPEEAETPNASEDPSLFDRRSGQSEGKAVPDPVPLDLGPLALLEGDRVLLRLSPSGVITAGEGGVEPGKRVATLSTQGTWSFEGEPLALSLRRDGSIQVIGEAAPPAPP